MKRKTKLLLAAALLGATFGTTAAGCGLFKGDYQLTDLSVNATGVALTYEIGDTVDLSGLQLTAKFSDDTTKTVELKDVKIFLGEDDITANLSVLTQTAGKKKIKIVYATEHGTESEEITITVNEEVIILDSIDDFNKPAFLAAFEAQIENAKDEDTTENEAVFFKNDGQEYYKVGDDNAFKLVPDAAVVDFETGDVNKLTNVTVNSTVKVLEDTQFVTLTKTNKEGAEFVYEYKQGETLLLTEYAAKNEFDFETAAVGRVFKLSVLPDSTAYEVGEEIDPISVEVEVVDAYNVYNTKQLSALDNSGRPAWTGYKNTLGFADVAENGVVLHSTMRLTIEDIPSDFYYTIADNYNVHYKDANGVSKTPEELGMSRTFLKQHFDNYADGQIEPNGNENYVSIYQRVIGAGKAFNFYGNYFEVDASGLPLVAAFAPTTDKNGNALAEKDTWYDTDFSNASLFHVLGQAKYVCATCGEQHGDPVTACRECSSTNINVAQTDETFRFDNLAIKGNAKSEQITVDVDAGRTDGAKSDTLVSAGGLILSRVNDAKATLDNVRNYNFFISFFANNGSEVEYNRTKCFDSFQNAIFLWGSANVTVKQSYFKRAGGPLMIQQHKDAEDGSLAIPHVTVDDASVLDTGLTGGEIWFTSVGANALIGRFRSELDLLFNQAGKSIFKDKTVDGGKMNILTLLMQSASNAEDAMNSVAAQGTFFYDIYQENVAESEEDTVSPRLDRMADTVLGQTVRGIITATGGQAPIINVGNKVFYYAGEQYGILNASNQPASQEFALALLGTDMTNPADDAQYIGFTLAGVSIVFQLFNLA